MKILLITLEYPPIIGGVSTYLQELYQGLDHDVEIISPANESFYVWWCWPRWLPFYFRLRKLVKEKRPDQIHVSHVLPVGTMAYWLFKSFKIPYVLIFHGTDLKAARAQPRKIKRVATITQHAAKVIVNSAATGELYKEIIPSGPEAVIIRPGAPMITPVRSDAPDELRTRYALDGTRVILFLARLVERKGILVALDAIAEVMKKNIEATLVIVGDGPMRARAEKRAQELKLYNRVRFIGRVETSEKWLWYSIAHLFWFPAQEMKHEWEGFGITSLEAQAHGCPVVVSDVDGLPESINPGVSGVVCDPTAEAFVEATAEILQDAALWQKMRASAREFAASHTWNSARALFKETINSI
jgi:phosphatidylinositol alpha-1,6-mannosyltransferase